MPAIVPQFGHWLRVCFDNVESMPQPLRRCHRVMCQWWSWLCQCARCHEEGVVVMDGDGNWGGMLQKYHKSVRQSSGWLTFDNSKNCQNCNCVLNSDNHAEDAITDQLYNHGIPASLKWSHTHTQKNPCTTTYKIWALTNKFWGS